MPLVTVTPQQAGSACPYCRFRLEASTSAFECPSCGALHHDDCWSDNGGCAVVGCGGRDEQGESSMPPVDRQRTEIPVSQNRSSRAPVTEPSRRSPESRQTAPQRTGPPVDPPTPPEPPSADSLMRIFMIGFGITIVIVVVVVGLALLLGGSR